MIVDALRFNGMVAIVTGVLTAAALVYAPARIRVPAQVAGVAVVVVLIAVLFVVKVASEPSGVFA